MKNNIMEKDNWNTILKITIKLKKFPDKLKNTIRLQ